MQRLALFFVPLLFLFSPPSQAAIQCYVGQKLFALESNMAVCASFIPYHCAHNCEWRTNCTSHASYDSFEGRRTFVSGILVNSKSLMLLCCASLSTVVQADRKGERCAWRSPDSIPVLSPSIRTDPVLGLNHYIREIRMERDGESRVDVQLEVCQYEKQFDHCREDKMSPDEFALMNDIKARLDQAQAAEEARTSTAAPASSSTTETPSTAAATLEAISPFPASSPSPISEGNKIEERRAIEDVQQTADQLCQKVLSGECGSSIHSRITACCKDLSACDRMCLKAVEKGLLAELMRKEHGCTSSEVRATLDCMALKVSNAAAAAAAATMLR